IVCDIVEPQALTGFAELYWCRCLHNPLLCVKGCISWTQRQSWVQALMTVMLYDSEAKVEDSSTETRAVTSPASSCPPLRRQMPDAVGAGDDHLRRQPEKQAVLNDA